MKTANVLYVLPLLLVGSVASAEGPTVYPSEPEMVVQKTRAEVMAEFLEARRLGLISYGEAPLKDATPDQERKIAEAGRRAAEQSRVAAK